MRQAPGRIIGISVDARGQSRPTAWRCRRASSTSAARRRPRTSAPRRRCSRTSRRCTRCITAPTACARLRDACPRPGARARSGADRARLRQTNAPTSTRCASRGPDVERGPRRRPRRRGSISATRPTARSASRSTRRRRSKTSQRHRHGRSRARGGATRTAVDPATTRPCRSMRRRALHRTSTFLTHPVFNTHHSETKMMRYIRSLERKDVGLDTSMIPLGLVHDEAERGVGDDSGHLAGVLADASVRAARSGGGLSADLRRARSARSAQITGFAAVSLQPNSGAQGEFAGLMTIRAYHRDRGDAASRRRADPVVRAWHQPGERDDGGAERSWSWPATATATSTSTTCARRPSSTRIACRR